MDIQVDYLWNLLIWMQILATTIGTSSLSSDINVIIVKPSYLDGVPLEEDMQKMVQESKDVLLNPILKLHFLEVLLPNRTLTFNDVFKKKQKLKNIHAILGPCSMLVLPNIVRLGSFWKIPVITPCGASILAADKSAINKGIRESYSHLIRVGETSSQVWKVRSKMNEKFGWKNSVYVKPDLNNTDWEKLGSIHCCQNYRGEHINPPTTKELFKKFIGEKAIIYFCGSRLDFLKTLDLALQYGYGNGHYTFIYSTSTIYLNKEFWMTFPSNEFKIENVKQMLKFVFILQPKRLPFKDLTFDDLHIRQRKLQSQGLDLDFYTDLLDGLKLVQDIYTSNLNSGSTPAKVLEDILDLVRDRSFNGSFNSSTVIRMNNTNDRIFDYSLLDYDSEKKVMQPVLLFNSMNHFSASECQMRNPSGICQIKFPAIDWGTKDNKVPSDISTCPAETDCSKPEKIHHFNEVALITGLVIASLATFVIIVIIIVCRKT